MIIKFKIMKNKKFIKRNLLNKISTIITKKINFKIKFILILLKKDLLKFFVIYY